MTISYNWLTEYLPVKLSPEDISSILTSIGLEVESLEKYEEIKGGLKGLVVGEVLEVIPHPNADKLRLTKVDIGRNEPLNIVCGAKNVAAGQKVIVAGLGATVYPVHGEPITIKAAKIRGEESMGMICAEDEIGLGQSHEGILVLDETAVPGTTAEEYFRPEEDWIYEIGLTPNRMDATSHIGVAKDVCAWLSSRADKPVTVELPHTDILKIDDHKEVYTVEVDNVKACPRYAGISLTHITVGESPAWLKKRLAAIGVRPINNVVDITNFVLHECGQPLHAFDGDAVAEHKIIVRNVEEGTFFVTLDGKERKLHKDDLMICDANGGMCIAGVFGGLHSGVTDKTTRLFLESACFDKVSVRRTSFRHDLRTDAAMRFEKGVDISGVEFALKRAANLMKDLCGARVSSEIIDVYPDPRPQTIVNLPYAYLDKLSGKHYNPDKVKLILSSLGFEIIQQDSSGLELAVPYSKSDISLPADLVEEVMRIDGYDEVAIPTHISIAPSGSDKSDEEYLKEKAASYLTSNGFFEIFTNSITNSKYYPEDPGLVHLMNSLNTALNVMRPSMLETGLEAIAHNINYKQTDLLLYELGRIYGKEAQHFEEKETLVLFATGNKYPESWIQPAARTDNYFLKGHIKNLVALLNDSPAQIVPSVANNLEYAQDVVIRGSKVGECGLVSREKTNAFGIRQSVWYAAFDWELLVHKADSGTIQYHEVSRYPTMRRDLALILDDAIPFSAVETIAGEDKSGILESVNLFDVFKSQKLGEGKKSYAVSFTFLHPERTLTDKEIDKVMQKLANSFEKNLQAEIRKQ